MRYGYARVSSKEQDLTIQNEQLHQANCDFIYEEKASGRTQHNRPMFQALLERVQPGDTIIVTKLDRFARSTKDALSVIERLNRIGVGLIILNLGGDQVDTTSPIGKLIVTVLAGIAEFEADMIQERQREGIQLAKERGLYHGRPKTYTAQNKRLQHALKLFDERATNQLSVQAIADITGISRATIYREAKQRG